MVLWKGGFDETGQKIGMVHHIVLHDPEELWTDVVVYPTIGPVPPSKADQHQDQQDFDTQTHRNQGSTFIEYPTPRTVRIGSASGSIPLIFFRTALIWASTVRSVVISGSSQARVRISSRLNTFVGRDKSKDSKRYS